MGHRGKLHNIMRLWGMCKVAGPRKWGWALQKWVEKCVPYVNENSRALFSGCKLTGTKQCLVVYVVRCLWLAEVTTAVPGSATQSLKPATLPLECLVWGQRSSQPGRNWTHTSFLNGYLGLPRLPESSPFSPGLVPLELQSCWASFVFLMFTISYLSLNVQSRYIVWSSAIKILALRSIHFEQT